MSLWLLLLLIVLAPLAAFLFRRLRSGRPPAPPPDPRAEALAAIDAADRNHADAHELAGCCAAALRRLLQQRFNLRQTGLTPHELTTRLPIERPAKAALRDFFDQCERLQFAGAPLSPEARQALLATARHLVAEYADPPIQAEEVHPA